MNKTEILVSFLQHLFIKNADEDTDSIVKRITATKAGYNIVTRYNKYSVVVLQSTTDNPCINCNHTIYQYIDGTWVPICTL